ncbi:hypothetical protein ACFQI3_02105 [Hansschlegelia quercus]|uniref:Uncharacterized protein n=1 Tax=Hansschlegelia quercus TaxID=2528245 RepID=A0A4Q9GK46_9HYPH|nr:hypothetical protein [Hansschlegelia quercus]TBN54729.1 hypothetical protein EYR15_00740 [Hansschlegelia quercus]
MSTPIASLIRMMAEAGAPAEAIAIAVEAIEGAREHVADEFRAQQNKKSAAAERTRRWRERRNTGDASTVTVETSRETSHSVTGDVTSSLPPEERSPEPPKTQTPFLPPQKPPSGAKRGSSSPNRGSRLPSDWKPSEVDRAFAANLGATSAEIERTAASFRDFWVAKAGRDAVKADWPATWRNWCRREAEGGRFTGRPRASSGPAPSSQPVSDQRWRERLLWAKERDDWRREWGPMPPENGSLVPAHLVDERLAALFNELRQQYSAQSRAG